MRSSILGAVLAGGGSRRFGRDKARLRLGGRTLAERAAGALAAELDEVVVVSRRLGDHADLGLPEIADRFPGRGPLAGIDAALRHAAGRPVFVLACDLPRVGSEVVGWLLELAAAAGRPVDEPWCAVPESEGRLQPLCGVYSPGCAGPIEARLRDGKLAVLDLLAEVDCLRVSPGPGDAFDLPELLANLNRPADGRRLGIEVAGEEAGDRELGSR